MNKIALTLLALGAFASSAFSQTDDQIDVVAVPASYVFVGMTMDTDPTPSFGDILETCYPGIVFPFGAWDIDDSCVAEKVAARDACVQGVDDYIQELKDAADAAYQNWQRALGLGLPTATYQQAYLDAVALHAAAVSLRQVGVDACNDEMDKALCDCLIWVFE